MKTETFLCLLAFVAVYCLGLNSKSFIDGQVLDSFRTSPALKAEVQSMIRDELDSYEAKPVDSSWKNGHTDYYEVPPQDQPVTAPAEDHSEDGAGIDSWAVPSPNQ